MMKPLALLQLQSHLYCDKKTPVRVGGVLAPKHEMRRSMRDSAAYITHAYVRASAHAHAHTHPRGSVRAFQARARIASECAPSGLAICPPRARPLPTNAPRAAAAAACSAPGKPAIDDILCARASRSTSANSVFRSRAASTSTNACWYGARVAHSERTKSKSIPIAYGQMKRTKLVGRMVWVRGCEWRPAKRSPPPPH